MAKLKQPLSQDDKKTWLDRLPTEGKFSVIRKDGTMEPLSFIGCFLTLEEWEKQKKYIYRGDKNEGTDCANDLYSYWLTLSKYQSDPATKPVRKEDLEQDILPKVRALIDRSKLVNAPFDFAKDNKPKLDEISRYSYERSSLIGKALKRKPKKLWLLSLEEYNTFDGYLRRSAADAKSRMAAKAVIDELYNTYKAIGVATVGRFKKRKLTEEDFNKTKEKLLKRITNTKSKSSKSKKKKGCGCGTILFLCAVAALLTIIGFEFSNGQSKKAPQNPNPNPDKNKTKLTKVQKADKTEQEQPKVMDFGLDQQEIKRLGLTNRQKYLTVANNVLVSMIVGKEDLRGRKGFHETDIIKSMERKDKVAEGNNGVGKIVDTLIEDYYNNTPAQQEKDRMIVLKSYQDALLHGVAEELPPLHTAQRNTQKGPDGR